MKILAFCDIHSNKKNIDLIKEKTKKHNPDVLVCAGDLSYFGLKLDLTIKLLGSIKKTIILIPGNHDDEVELKVLCSKYKNLIYVHKKTFSFENYLFIGYGGLGFSEETKDLEKYMFGKEIKNKKVVLIFHQPPYGTKLDYIDGLGHVGNKSMTKVIKKIKPVLSLFGHIHETFGKKDRIGDSLIVNPGPNGMIIDI